MNEGHKFISLGYLVLPSLNKAFTYLLTKCFNEVKKILSSPPLLKYFDPDQDLELQCDVKRG